MKTKQEITMQYRDHGTITIPKGTRVTNQTACGFDPNIFFIDSFDWIKPWPDGTEKSGLIHDATYYGISISREFVE